MSTRKPEPHWMHRKTERDALSEDYESTLEKWTKKKGFTEDQLLDAYLANQKKLERFKRGTPEYAGHLGVRKALKEVGQKVVGIHSPEGRIEWLGLFGTEEQRRKYHTPKRG